MTQESMRDNGVRNFNTHPEGIRCNQYWDTLQEIGFTL